MMKLDDVEIVNYVAVDNKLVEIDKSIISLSKNLAKLSKINPEEI